MDALVEIMRMLGHRRWDSMTEAQKQEHIRRMVAGQRRSKRHRRAKAAKAKDSPK